MLGKNIKDYLDENGIRYSHVSEKTNIPMNVLSPMLNEKREIKATEYFKICDALGVGLDRFKEPDQKGA
ncbi:MULTISPECIES: helix-turn-helix domain-containing protein [Enterocloster]|uniref:helix-turn-helix domain-containing protein n=1 Tax=Enterocloster TaxID=2719313 RepID=UPI0004654DF5|nr:MULTISPECIES: helix-turn-helix transcriptional regulator [Enterocloster]